MTPLGTACAKLLGLFVDDGRFAGAIVVWLGLTWLVLPRLAVPRVLAAPILFAGLAAILAWGGVRQTRLRRPCRAW